MKQEPVDDELMPLSAEEQQQQQQHQDLRRYNPVEQIIERSQASAAPSPSTAPIARCMPGYPPPHLYNGVPLYPPSRLHFRNYPQHPTPPYAVTSPYGHHPYPYPPSRYPGHPPQQHPYPPMHPHDPRLYGRSRSLDGVQPLGAFPGYPGAAPHYYMHPHGYPIPAPFARHYPAHPPPHHPPPQQQPLSASSPPPPTETAGPSSTRGSPSESPVRQHFIKEEPSSPKVENFEEQESVAVPEPSPQIVTGPSLLDTDGPDPLEGQYVEQSPFERKDELDLIKPLRETLQELKDGVAAKDALQPRYRHHDSRDDHSTRPEYSWIRAYFMKLDERHVKHDREDCGSLCRGTHHSKGYYCRFCLKQVSSNTSRFQLGMAYRHLKRSQCKGLRGPDAVTFLDAIEELDWIPIQQSEAQLEYSKEYIRQKRKLETMQAQAAAEAAGLPVKRKYKWQNPVAVCRPPQPRSFPGSLALPSTTKGSQSSFGGILNPEVKDEDDDDDDDDSSRDCDYTGKNKRKASRLSPVYLRSTSSSAKSPLSHYAKSTRASLKSTANEYRRMYPDMYDDGHKQEEAEEWMEELSEEEQAKYAARILLEQLGRIPAGQVKAVAC